MRRWSRLPCVALIAWACLPLIAQPAMPVEVASGTVSLPARTLDNWAKLYMSGDWARLSAELDARLNGVTVPAVPGGGSDDVIINAKNSTYVVVFPSSFRTTDGELLRVLFRRPAPEPYATTIVDSRVVDEIFVSQRSTDTLATFYVSTDIDDPLSAGLAGFVKQFDPKLLGPFFPLAADTSGGNVDHAIKVRRVMLPSPRAKIEIKDELRLVGAAKPIALTTTWSAVPLTRVSLGVLYGVMASSHSGGTRVKLANGKLVADPLSGGLTAALVNVHLQRYDGSRKRLTAAERWRVFAGPVLTPELGIVVGVGASVVRGLTLNVGYSGLRVNGLGPNEKLDAAPVNARDPFTHKVAGVTVFGLSYTFK